MTSPATAPVTVRACPSAGLSASDLGQLLDLFRMCWPEGDFSAEDVEHALGDTHWLAESDGRIVAHASVVPRVLEADGVPLSTGYLEAVATQPDWRRRGIASRLLREANAHIEARYELGGLSTGVPELYARAGWVRWAGPTFVRTDAGPVRTEEDDDGVMVLLVSRTPPLALRGSLSCESRPGDAW